MKALINLILSLVLMVWFIASIAAMVYVSRSPDRSWLVPVLLGQYLLVFGILGTAAFIGAKKKGWWLSAVACIVGAGVIIAALVYHNGSVDTRAAMVQMMPAAVGALIMLVGIFGAVSVPVNRALAKKKYTTELEGVCVEHATRLGRRGSVLKSPVYEIELNGKTQRLQKHVYSNIGQPQIGETRTLYIDETDLESYREPISDTKLENMGYIIYIPFIIAGIAIIAAVIGHTN